MADLIGQDNGELYVTNSKKKYMKIYQAREGLRGVPCVISESPESDFRDFCSLFGNSTEEFIILLYDNAGEEGDELTGEKKKGGALRHGRLKTTFSFQPRQRVSMGAPGPVNSNQPLTIADVIKIMDGRQPTQQVDVAAVVKGAIQEVTHKHQMEVLTSLIADIQKNSAREMAMMRNEMREMMEDEEEERAKDAEAEAYLEGKRLELQTYEKLAGMGQQVLGEVKNVVYEFTGRKAISGNAPLRKVAAPGADTQEAAVEYKIPVSDQVGQLAPYGPLPDKADAEGWKKFQADQNAKMTNYCGKMYSECNAHLGDDLALLYKMYKDMPIKYNEMVEKLREQMGS